MIYLTYNLPPPANVTNMFGNWLNGVNKKDKERIRIGISASGGATAIWSRVHNFTKHKKMHKFSNQQHTKF
jgi:hypothetical protein